MSRRTLLLCLIRQAAALSCRRRGAHHQPVLVRNKSCFGSSIIRRSPPPLAPLLNLMKEPIIFEEGSGGSRLDDDWRGPTGAPGSLERLCSVSLRACRLMNPLVAAIYRRVSQNSDDDDDKIKKAKRDTSAFTIADGMVQRLLIQSLFSRIEFRGIVGEEEEEERCEGKGGDVDNTDEWWYRVEGLTIPEELRPLVASTRSEIESLASGWLSTDECNDYRHLTVFIDPIDGTREFSSGKGEQCSVCIGFSNERGKAVAGVVYRPLSLPNPTWVAGAKSEAYAACDFGRKSSTASKGGAGRGGLLTTNGSISPFLSSLMEELDLERVKSGGAGNKMMMLLENSISGGETDDGDVLYIQDRGVSRWDTCAAEACLESFGGKLAKLTNFAETDDDNAYTYLASETNLDFVPGGAGLTRYNCRASTVDPRPGQKAIDVNDVKPYSNLCGLVALGKESNTMEATLRIKEAICRAATRNPPSYD